MTITDTPDLRRCAARLMRDNDFRTLMQTFAVDMLHGVANIPLAQTDEIVQTLAGYHAIMNALSSVEELAEAYEKDRRNG